MLSIGYVLFYTGPNNQNCIYKLSAVIFLYIIYVLYIFLEVENKTGEEMSHQHWSSAVFSKSSNGLSYKNYVSMF